jgi:alkylated DNA repair dioxygenase AlkB
MTRQRVLFDDGEPQLVADDACGRIEYVPDLLDAAAADDAFAELHAQVRWRSLRREMYGRDVDVPRLLASYRLGGHGVPAPIERIAARVATRCDAPFDSVGLNLYRDRHDSVAPHNDHLYEIAEGQPIALVSLGATRPMVLARRTPPRRRIALELAPGSLLLMSHATQHHYDHGIPKLAYDVAPRISLAFRVRPTGD